jgi:hypothetical protein
LNVEQRDSPAVEQRQKTDVQVGLRSRGLFNARAARSEGFHRPRASIFVRLHAVDAVRLRELQTDIGRRKWRAALANKIDDDPIGFAVRDRHRHKKGLQLQTRITPVQNQRFRTRTMRQTAGGPGSMRFAGAADSPARYSFYWAGIPLSRALTTSTRASSILGVRPLRVKLIPPFRTPEAKELYIRRSTKPAEALAASGVGTTGAGAEAWARTRHMALVNAFVGRREIAKRPETICRRDGRDGLMSAFLQLGRMRIEPSLILTRAVAASVAVLTATSHQRGYHLAAPAGW